MENTYYLGLDMGSASLGWAVTDILQKCTGCVE